MATYIPQDATGVLISDISKGTQTNDVKVTLDGEAVTIQEPLSVDDNGSSLTVDQSTHDNLNANANLQVGDADVANGNPVPVSDAGGSLTIDGTVTANLSATDNAVLDSIDTNTGLTVTGLSSINAKTPSASVTADDFALPTTTDIKAFGMVYDGATWDMQRGDATDGTLVNLGSNNDVTVTSGTITTITNDVSIDDGGNVISVDDAGGSLTIDGTVTANLSATDNAVLDSIDTNTLGTVTLLTTHTNKFPASTSASDNDVNPSATDIKAFGMVYDGSTWDRQRGDSTNGTLVNLGSNNDVEAAGDVAHDSADSGNPVKIGAKAIDYEPDSGSEEGPTAVAANDRVNIAANLRGEIVPAVKAQYVELTDLDQAYDGTPSTDVSANVECWQYRKCTVGFEATETGTATDILFEVEVSYDGTTFYKMMNNFLSDWRYDDTSVTGGIEEAMTFDIACHSIRVRVTCTGVDGSNYFTLDNCFIYLRT